MLTSVDYPQSDLAERLKKALEDSGVRQVDLARACGVTEQAVHGWITNGRIGKHHLPTISAITGKGLDYFLVGLKMGRRAAALALFFLVPLAFLAPQDSHAAEQYSARLIHRLCIMLNRLWMKIVQFIQRCDLSQIHLQIGTAR